MIKLAKLVSQEFVIGRHIDNVLTNVAAIQFNTNTTTGEQGLKIVPYMTPITQSLAKIIPADKIIWMEDAPQQLQISYLEMLKVMLQKIEDANKAQEAQEAKDVNKAKVEETEITKGETNDGPDGVSKTDSESTKES